MLLRFVFGPANFGPPRFGFARFNASFNPPPVGVSREVTTVSLSWKRSFNCSLDMFCSSSSDTVSSICSVSVFWCLLFGSSSGLFAFSSWPILSLGMFVGELLATFARSLFQYTSPAAVVTGFGDSVTNLPLKGFVSAAPLFRVSSIGAFYVIPGL